MTYEGMATTQAMSDLMVELTNDGVSVAYNPRHVPVPLYEVVQVEGESLYIDMLIGDIQEYGEHAWLCVFAAHSWSGEGGFVDQYYD